MEYSQEQREQHKVFKQKHLKLKTEIGNLAYEQRMLRAHITDHVYDDYSQPEMQRMRAATRWMLRHLHLAYAILRGKSTNEDAINTIRANVTAVGFSGGEVQRIYSEETFEYVMREFGVVQATYQP